MADHKDLHENGPDWEIQKEVDTYLSQNSEEIQNKPQKLLDKIAELIGVEKLVTPTASALEPALSAVKDRIAGTAAIMGEGNVKVDYLSSPEETAKRRVIVVNKDSDELMEFRILTGECGVSGPKSEYPNLSGPVNSLKGEQFDKFFQAMRAVGKWNTDQMKKAYDL